MLKSCLISSRINKNKNTVKRRYYCSSNTTDILNRIYKNNEEYYRKLFDNKPFYAKSEKCYAKIKFYNRHKLEIYDREHVDLRTCFYSLHFKSNGVILSSKFYSFNKMDAWLLLHDFE